MRYNALVITGPLIAVCFVWNAKHGFIKRHAIAIAAWIAVTMSAQLISSALRREAVHLAHQLALCDMAATLRYTDDTIPMRSCSARCRPSRATESRPACLRARRRQGCRLRRQPVEDGISDVRPAARRESRAAVTRAWKAIVFDHLGAYLTYRWEIFRRLLGLADPDFGSPVYNWFSDVQDPGYSALRADHDAAPGRIQDELRAGFTSWERTPMFHVMLYVVLTLLLIPFSFCDRRAFALLSPAITSEGVLFLISRLRLAIFVLAHHRGRDGRDPDRDYAHVSQGRRVKWSRNALIRRRNRGGDGPVRSCAWSAAWISDDGLIYVRVVRQILAGHGRCSTRSSVRGQHSALWPWLLALIGWVTGGDLGRVSVVTGIACRSRESRSRWMARGGGTCTR